MTSSLVDAQMSLGLEAANSQGLISVQGPGKAKKEDKDKIKLTDLIDKTKATKDERDADVDEVDADLLLDESGNPILKDNEADIYAELAVRHEDTGADNDQIFLIDGDSLLHEILLDPLLDLSHGGQFLHVIYALEQYIKRFQEGGRIFRFVFFHCTGSVAWHGNAFISLVRDRVIAHLRELHMQVNEFTNWWEAGFIQFLERVDPAFVLVGDGAGVDLSASSSSSAPATADSVAALTSYMSGLSVSSSAAAGSLQPAEITRSLTLFLLSYHFRVIRLTELSFAGNAMYGFQMAMASAYKKKLREAGGYKPDEKLAAIKGDVPTYTVESQKQFDAKVYAAAAAVQPADRRLAATLYAIVRSLQLAGGNATKADASGLSPADFARAALIHTVLLQSLPVDARALVWEAAEEKSRAPLVKYAALLASFQQQLLVAWCGSKSSEVPASGVDLAPTLDLFDGRLLSFVLYALRDKKITSLGWSASLEKQLQASWDVVKKEAKAADFLPLFSLKSIAASGVTDLDESQLAKDAREKASKERTSVVAGAKVGGAKAAATSGAAGTAAPAKAEDEDLGNWDDEDAEVTPAPKKAAPAPAPKKEEEEELGSWEDMSDEEEEKVEEKKAAPVAAAAAAAPAVATSSSAESVVPPEAKELQPIVTLENKFVKDISGALDARLQAHGLLLADSAYAKPLTPYAVKYAITPEKPQLDDGMDSEVKVAAPTTKKEQRSVSRMVNYWEQYSKSLVGGRLVLREVVIASVKEEADEDDDEEEEKKSDKKGGKKDKADKPKKAGKPGAGGGKKGTKSAVAGEKLSIKDKIRQQVEDAQKAKDAKKIQGKINIASSMSTLPNKIAKLDSELEQVGDASAIPALLQLLEWEMALWKESKPKNEIEPAIKLFVLIHDIYRRFRQFLSADEFKKVMTALIQIGYEDFAHRMAKEFAQLSEGKFTYEQVKVDVKSSSFPATLIGMNYNRFQLEYCGPYMLRNVDSAPDPRVTSFYPDLWQRKLLDVADANESALLVAPTSAGKSFISYYVLKNVLAANKVTERTSEKGVVVYVAPNKALVNQVSADIYQRYGLVFGTATDDHQDKALTSEVLITVPSVLERLLLSPHRESWIKKIRWVIFDEVHLISSAGEGSIWERCLALIRCPFLALSATVGNPSEFHGWLSRLDALRNRKVHVIVHQTRWSDLEKAMYVPADPSIAPHVAFADNNFKFDMRNFSLLPSQWTGVRVHPAAAVGDNFGDNLEFPSEISFTPRDSLSLYDALAKFSQSLPENLKKEFAALSPEVFFPEMLIPKARAMEYESTLKKVLAQWLKAGLTKEVNQVMAALTGDLKDRLAKMEGNAKVGQNCYDNAFIRRHFFSLLLELHARDQLPGIVFSNDSELCVQLVTDTLEKLEELESKTLEQESNTADSKAKIKQKAAMLKALKKKRDATMKNKTAEEEARYADELDIEIEADKDEYIVDPRFSFIDQTEKMDAKELDYWVKRTLYKTQWKKTHPLIRALYRGIGVHHGGLVKQYRDLVETLFRGKHLKVVVSTASLALGINMPARSVTLCGDSKLLTPLQYRQMSGRAGRRGYDNVGHVMFFAIPPRKVYRLLKSPLNSLRGHYPVNSTLTLRMSDYYTIVNDKKEATGALTPLLREPFFQTTWSGQNLLAQINYHFRFNLDYLFQKSLINVKGAAYGLSTLATHMHAADPSNFGFTALLESGHLSKICQRFDIDKNGVAKELLTLLAHLFYRVPVPSHLTRANFRADSHNLILLPPLDPEVKKIISQHNATTMSQFTNYLKSFAQLELGKVPVDPAADAAAIAAAAKTESSASKVYEGFYQLPVSGVNFPWVWSKTNAADDASTLSGALSSARLSIEARSPFVATSGHDDSFDSSRNLAESVRNGIFLDSKLIPVCMDDRDARGKELQLNAYVVDFYWKQHFYSLVTDNRLSDAFAWGLLKNWSLLLNNITVALKTLSSDAANDLVVKSFDHLSTTFESYFSGIINI